MRTLLRQRQTLLSSVHSKHKHPRPLLYKHCTEDYQKQIHLLKKAELIHTVTHWCTDQELVRGRGEPRGNEETI